MPLVVGNFCPRDDDCCLTDERQEVQARALGPRLTHLRGWHWKQHVMADVSGSWLVVAAEVTLIWSADWWWWLWCKLSCWRDSLVPYL